MQTRQSRTETAERSLILLAWWEAFGRKDPALKPWMYTKDGRWPEPHEPLHPLGCWIAEVMLYSTTYMASLVSSGDPSHGVGLFLSAGFHWRPGQWR